MFRLFRYYSIASLVVFLVAAGIMVVAYRTVAVQGIINLAESNNLALARAAVEPIRADLVDYLSVVNSAGTEGHAVPLPPALERAIDQLMRDPNLVRIKIIGRDGAISYSTQHDLIGTSEVGNPDIGLALSGSRSASMIYRDAFNIFARETDEDNMVQSYLPVRSRSSEPVLGVFEVYTNVDALVKETERTEIAIAVVTILILGGLYTTLLVIVRRATRVIEVQQETIGQKNMLLEQLSRRSQRREELERKKFAAELHEGLAQTLSAVKVAVEATQGHDAAGSGADVALKAIVPPLQSAIRQARAIAMELRPPSLDQFGLLPTIHALCREFSELYPRTRLAEEIAVPEGSIPDPLKMVVYRNIETALKAIGDAGVASAIKLALRIEDHHLTLVVEDNGDAVAPAREMAYESEGVQSPLSTLRDRTVLSGGVMSLLRNLDGGTTLRLSWGI